MFKFPMYSTVNECRFQVLKLEQGALVQGTLAADLILGMVPYILVLGIWYRTYLVLNSMSTVTARSSMVIRVRSPLALRP